MEQQAAEIDIMAKKADEDAMAAPSQVAEPARTPLYDEHISLGARMVEFGGWMMPVQYTKGIIEEHKFVRSHVGIFDTCHMGEFVITGPDALQLLQTFYSNN